MDAKLIKNDQLSLSCKFYKETILTSPTGKTMTSKELAAITELGLDTSTIVSTEVNLATINIGSGRSMKGMTEQQVQALINVLNCTHKSTDVNSADATLLKGKYCDFSTTRTIVKPINITFDNGAIAEITADMIDYNSRVAVLVPEEYFGNQFRLRNVYGYSVKFSSRDTIIGVGCHTYNFADLIVFLQKIHAHLLS